MPELPVNSPPTSCPLCGTQEPVFFHQDRQREYWQCPGCQLVFVPPRNFLSSEEELACYQLHQNSPDDTGYRTFLGRLATPLIRRLTPGDSGLDFGSGPGPTLSVMLTEGGFPTSIYDPFFAPDDRVWNRSYDFVTATEVVEHLHHPRRELERLWSVLAPGGWLGIMTKRVRDATAFATWHYKNDPTHVIFFAETTFVWLADQWSAELEICGNDVVLLRKPG